jgi:hypothetical protein
MPTESPPIAGAPYDDLPSAVEALVQAYTADPGVPGSGFQPSPTRPDGISALIRIFAVMAGHVVNRLNRVPDRSFLAFLNLLGTGPAPPRPARVPLTFSLAKGSTAEPLVPAGTRVGAPGDVVFETTRDLVVTQARIASVFVRQVDGDRYADRSAQAATVAQGYYEAFGGETPAEHALYLSSDAILGLPPETEVTLTLDFATHDDAVRWQALHDAAAVPPLDDGYPENALAPPLVAWSYWDGGAWRTLAPSHAPLAPAPGTSFTLAFKLPADIAATVVNGESARWIRAQLKAWTRAPIPAIQKAALGATLGPSGLAPDVALSGGRPLDLTMDFYPLGERPRFNDTIYIGSDDVFSRPSAVVTVTAVPSTQQTALKSTDKPVLAWEVWTGSAWTNVATAAPSATASATDPLWTVRFTLPAKLAPLVIQGTKSHWLRVRLVSGGFGKGLQVSTDNTKSPAVTTLIDDGYRPPLLHSLTLGYTAAPSVAPACVACNDLAFSDCPKAAPFVPFVRTRDVSSALYLGFDRPFPNRPMLLYVEVAPLALPPPGKVPTAPPAAPLVVWEYSTADGFAALGAGDGTRSFAESGLVELMGPADFASREDFGQRCFWLRARLDRGGYAIAPRLGRVLLNTVWGTHTVTIAGEDLGSSDLSAGQRFTLSQAPVLAGARIEVREPTPSPEEHAAIEALEGPDAISIVPGGDARVEEAWVRWHAVPDFHGSGPRDRHYCIDLATGQVRFGDGIAGMVPPRGVRNVRATWYQTGGGAAGNCAAGTVAELKTTIPYVDGVTNHAPASGGADAEPIDRTKSRAPAMLRHRSRAVTAEDFEDLARDASPAVARARAITPHFDPIQLEETPAAVPDAGHVTMVIIPYGDEPQPSPSAGLLRDVEDYLLARAAPAVTLEVLGPTWLEVDVVNLTVEPVTLEDADALRGEIVAALERFFHPLTGGPDGGGWAFGQLPYRSDVLALLGAIRGVDAIRSLSLEVRYAADRRVVFDEVTAGNAVERVLVSSGTHEVHIASPEARG